MWITIVKGGYQAEHTTDNVKSEKGKKQNILSGHIFCEFNFDHKSLYKNTTCLKKEVSKYRIIKRS